MIGCSFLFSCSAYTIAIIFRSISEKQRQNLREKYERVPEALRNPVISFLYYNKTIEKLHVGSY